MKEKQIEFLDSGREIEKVYLQQGQQNTNIAHGIALGVGDVTVGKSGKKTVWTEEVLRDAAEKLEGKPLVKDHPNPKSASPPVDTVVGEVRRSKYVEDKGIVFEAEIDDEELAEQIRKGRFEVSPFMQRQLSDEKDPETDAFLVEKILDFRDLGLVSSGASPSSNIEGGRIAMSAEALKKVFEDKQKEALQEDIEYNLTDLGADNFDRDDFIDDEWNGSEVVSALPNPSQDEEAPGILDDTHALIPQGEEARSSKNSWKAPYRASPEGGVNTRALVAIKSAAGGARGGFDDVDPSLLDDLEMWANELLMEAPDDLFGSISEEQNMEQLVAVRFIDDLQKENSGARAKKLL